MKLYLQALFLASFFSVGCSSFEGTQSVTTHFAFEIVSPVNSAHSGRQLASTPKSIFLKKCSHQVTTSSCASPFKPVDYALFIKHLQKRLETRAFVSQQIALLEYQLASLQMDREIIQTEIEQFDRSLNRTLSPDAIANIRYLRVTIVLDAEELDRKIQLTQADLGALKQPVKSPGPVSLETAKLLELLESPQAFGNSLVYRDNLFAQAMDAIAREML